MQGLIWWIQNQNHIYFVEKFLPLYIPSYSSCHASLALFFPVMGICSELKGNFMMCHQCAFAQAAVCVYDAVIFVRMFFPTYQLQEGQISFLSVLSLLCKYLLLQLPWESAFCFSVCHPCFTVNSIIPGILASL